MKSDTLFSIVKSYIERTAYSYYQLLTQLVGMASPALTRRYIIRPINTFNVERHVSYAVGHCQITPRINNLGQFDYPSLGWIHICYRVYLKVWTCGTGIYSGVHYPRHLIIHAQDTTRHRLVPHVRHPMNYFIIVSARRLALSRKASISASTSP